MTLIIFFNFKRPNFIERWKQKIMFFSLSISAYYLNDEIATNLTNSLPVYIEATVIFFGKSYTFLL